jgi:multiple antibiotic resistance protein
MVDFTNVFLLVYAALFPIINPIGGAPLFLGLTADRSETERNALARGVGINSALLLIGSMFVGSHLLVFFGITLPAVRIAGGMVLIAFAWKLLHTGTDHEDQRAAAAERHTDEVDSFYPLTMPLTVGPGSIAVAIALGSQRPSGVLGVAELAQLAGAAIAGILAMALTIYVCFRFAERTIRMLGKTGTNVMVRLSAFRLLCIGVQVLWAGYSTLVMTPK